MPSDLHDAMVVAGFDPAVAKVYSCVLARIRADAGEIARDTRLNPTDVYGGLEKLCRIMVIGRDDAHGAEFFFAEEPRTAWRAAGIDWVWKLATQPEFYRNEIALRLPEAMEGTTDLTRGILANVERIATAASPLYRPGRGIVHTHQWRVASTQEQATILLLNSLQASSQRIRATSSGPRLPTVAQVWQVLVARIQAGVRYQRTADLQEAIEHGLKIVSRDIKDAGVQVCFGDTALIKHTCYVIDRDIVVILRKDASAGETTASFSRQPSIVSRYLGLFNKYTKGAMPGRFVVAALNEEADARLAEAQAEGCTSNEIEWLQCLVDYGVFCKATLPYAGVAERMAGLQLIKRGTTGDWVFNFQTEYSTLWRRWSALKPEQRSAYEYHEN